MAMVKTDPQHYSDIAAAIRTKSGATAQYKPQEMPGAILNMETGSLQSAILVYAPAGSQITLTCGDIVRTVPEDNGLWRFENCALGSWLVKASQNGITVEYPVEIQEQGQLMRYEVHVVYAHVYGICRNITSSSPAWTRTDDAVGKTVSVSVGSLAGRSDFDEVRPWSGIHRETMSTGDVMVKIPRFWYQRYREDNMEYIKIADQQKAGFKLHPAFCHGGVERECLYIGAYKTGENNLSVSGVLPRTGRRLADCRTDARTKGAGWGLADMASLSAVQMLFLVEFATYDSQSVLAKGYCSKGVSDSKCVTGTTDSVPNLTGQPVGTNGYVDMVWRGLEGIWGNVYELIDGVISDGPNASYYVCNDPALYCEAIGAGYYALSYPIAARGQSGQYIKRLGYSEGALDHIMLPEDAAGGSASTYICDTTSASGASVSVMRYGGRWSSGNEAGLFMTDFTSSLSSAHVHNAVRLIYIPQEVTP